MSDLANCGLCGGLLEDGQCDTDHSTTGVDRVEMSMKAWIAQMSRESGRAGEQN
jgi:hypothetical protein